ncbi:hypothetical protein BB341_19575 [Streptomyces clavuligerus]|nr:hypothetical protein BB341_19575 [Streptomyces clavuligerus]
MAWKTSRSSGVIREVSPTTSPGSRARASGASPSDASRSPARSSPAPRCTAVGPPTTSGAPPWTRRSAAYRSAPCRGGARRPVSRSRVEGSSPSHRSGAARVPGRTTTRTGVRVRVAVPSPVVTRVASASNSRAVGAMRSPRTRGTVRRASEVRVSSTVAVA